MFSTLDEQTQTTEPSGTSRFRLFVRIAGVAVLNRALFGGLYLGILPAE
jgi:hypothetical protein